MEPEQQVDKLSFKYKIRITKITNDEKTARFELLCFEF